jgi:hypothetical protein
VVRPTDDVVLGHSLYDYMCLRRVAAVATHGTTAAAAVMLAQRMLTVGPHMRISSTVFSYHGLRSSSSLNSDNGFTRSQSLSSSSSSSASASVDKAVKTKRTPSRIAHLGDVTALPRYLPLVPKASGRYRDFTLSEVERIERGEKMALICEGMLPLLQPGASTTELAHVSLTFCSPSLFCSLAAVVLFGSSKRFYMDLQYMRVTHESLRAFIWQLR